MKLTRIILALFVAVLMFPVVAVGQASENAAIQEASLASQKSPRELRQDLWRAEKDFYNIYNKLNDDALYDVRCYKETPTASMIRVQVCRPNFLARAIKEGKLSKGVGLGTNSDIEDEIATFRKNLATLVAANSDLKSAADTLNLAHDQVEADKERRAKN
ncbi:MAG: hypothetical protein ACR2QT_08245 [Woeseiaceae bacterium]